MKIVQIILSVDDLDVYLKLADQDIIDDWARETPGAQVPYLSKIKPRREERYELACGKTGWNFHPAVFALKFSSEVAAILFKLRWL